MLSFKVKCAILVLGELKSACNDPQGLKAAELKLKLGFPARLQQLLISMKHCGLISQSTYRGAYILQADLSELTVMDLISLVDPESVECGNWLVAGAKYPDAVKFDSDLTMYYKNKMTGKLVSDLLSSNR